MKANYKHIFKVVFNAFVPFYHQPSVELNLAYNYRHIAENNNKKLSDLMVYELDLYKSA